jgi:hypothetical protein
VKPSTLYTDAEPSACSKVATFLYAAMDDARQRVPSPYPAGMVNDAVSAYETMRQNDAKHGKPRSPSLPFDKRTAANLANSVTLKPHGGEMLEHDQNAWKQGA